MLNQVSLVENLPKANRIEDMWVIFCFVVPMPWLSKLFENDFLFFIPHEVTKIWRVSGGPFSVRHVRFVSMGVDGW